MPLVSILIPAYNEGPSIAALLAKVRAAPLESLGFQKEVIVVDDGSQDATANIARAFLGTKVLVQTLNQGKGAALRRAIQASTGDLILIQDADLEYDPQDYPALLQALRPGVDAVYGSRTLGQIRAHHAFSFTPGRHPQQAFGAWLAAVLLSLWTFLLYGKWLTDTWTAYKLFPAALLTAMNITTSGFETDHEITAKLLKRGCHIVEVPISYSPRNIAAGKKIKAGDGFVAVWTLFKFRFFSNRF